MKLAAIRHTVTAYLQNINKRQSVTTGHHTNTTVPLRIIMLHNNDKAEWNRSVSYKQKQ